MCRGVLAKNAQPESNHGEISVNPNHETFYKQVALRLFKSIKVRKKRGSALDKRTLETGLDPGWGRGVLLQR